MGPNKDPHADSAKESPKQPYVLLVNVTVSHLKDEQFRENRICTQLI